MTARGSGLSLAAFPSARSAAQAKHPCVQCASLGPTCCQRCEVVLTDGDIRRIANYSGRRDFWEYRPPTDSTYLDQDDDPNWPRWTVEPDGTRCVLRRGPAGDCTFLTSEGCSLPVQVRPLICRIYPYSYTEAGIDGIAEGCPPVLVPRGKTILEVLDMKLVDARRWHGMLYQELRERAERRGGSSLIG